MTSLSPNKCAQIIASSIDKIEKNRDKKTTRFQLSLLSISKIAQRQVVNHRYLESLATELLEKNFCMFQIENTRFAFIRSSSVNSWVKFSSKTILGAEYEK